MLLITVVAVVLVAVMALMLVVSGPIAEALGNVIGLGGTALVVWNIAKWPVIVILVVVAIAILYYATPNGQQLFGAEFDAEVERGRELQGGIEAEESIQLPPRDTSRSDKLHRQEQEEIARGRELREENDGQDKG